VTDALQAQLDEMTAELLDRYEELTLLYDLGGALATLFDVEEISAVALAKAARAVGAEHAELTFAGDAPAGSVPEQVIATGRQLLLHEGDPAPDGVPAPAAALSVPLLLPGEEAPIGALTLTGGAGSRFTAGDAKLAATVASQLASAIYRSRVVESMRETEAVRRELELAAGIQRSLLPAHPPELAGVELAALCVPAANVGGDYYDFLVDEAGRVSLVIADVAGHSIGAALMMAMARSILRRELSEGAHPAAVLAATNDAMFDDLVRAGLFITAFCARYDPVQRRLEYANAGQNLPLLRRAATGELLELDADGASLGILRAVEFEQGSIELEPRDTLLLFTDGVTEAAAASGEQFGDERLGAVFDGRAPAELTMAVLGAVRAHAGGVGQSDDVTLVVLRAKGTA
jgi:sigma-B regulation protein RsbU (phosphoserine phosphatase)